MAFLEYLIYPAKQTSIHGTYYIPQPISTSLAVLRQGSAWKTVIFTGTARHQNKEKPKMFQSRTKYAQFMYRGVLSLSLNKCQSNMLTTGFGKQV